MEQANSEIAKSWPRAVLAISTIALSWLLMQAVHESGHVGAAWLSGGSVRRVVLVPWEISRTDIHKNPQPLLVCWAGPLVGVLLPIAAWLLCRRWSGAFWLRFFAGFCLIANGVYLGVGSFTHDGDAGDLLRDGAAAWMLWLFGALTVPIGFVMWHGLGKQFGFGPGAAIVRWSTAMVCVTVLAVVVTTEVICDAISR